MNSFVFDIETGIDPAISIPPFDPSTIKVGNIKDPDKIAEKIREAKESHERDYRETAALSPLSGRILAIGFMDVVTNEPFTYGFDGADEDDLLNRFWHMWDSDDVSQLIGFNSHAFDLPYIIKRSMRFGVAWDKNIRSGRYWHPKSVDLMEKWQMGDWQNRTSLDKICRFLQIGEKSGKGADFDRLFHGTPEEKKQSQDYLVHDLALTAALARRLL